LYEESGSGGTRGVLEVTVKVCFTFLDGGSGGALVLWTDKEKADYMADFKRYCAAAWAEQHRLLKTSPAKATLTGITDVGVIFDIQTRESLTLGSMFTHCH
jgi:hypothetical protein